MPTNDPEKRRSYERKYERSNQGKAARKKYKSSGKGIQVARAAYQRAYKKTKSQTDYYVCGAGRFASLRQSAKQRGVAFVLTREELRNWWEKTPDICEYCQMSLDDYRQFRDHIVAYTGSDWAIDSFKALLKSKNHKVIDQLTVDRRESGKGYEIANLAKCCWFCNSIKHRFLTASEMRVIGPRIVSDLKAAIDKENEYRIECDPSWNRLGYFQQVFVKKGWGSERWLWNGAAYCGKILFFEKGKRCSYHYHPLKDEVLYLHSGQILMMYGDGDVATEWLVMQPGMAFHVTPGLRHQMFAEEESLIYEFSTHHEDSDSIRVVRGD